MPYADPERQREFQRRWYAERRAAFFQGKSCSQCEGQDDLQLDHRDPTQKVSHRFWSWSQERREVELEKCQILCGDCHTLKTAGENRERNGGLHHGKAVMYNKYGCRCEPCRGAKSEENQRFRSRGTSSIG